MLRQNQARLVGIFTSDRAKGAVVMKFRPEIAKLVDEVIDEFGSYDLDPKDVGQDATEESHYLRAHRHEYIRTVQDIVDHAPVANGGRVLELGAFFGVVSICLARLGYTVTAADMPEFMELQEQIERFSKQNVGVAGVRLQDYVLNFEEGAYDAVIMCEVLEHLNFNPVPLLKEINRILSIGGVFYLAHPNAASIYNRIDVAKGNSYAISVDFFFRQVDPKENEIVYGHWREYTLPETREMLERLDFNMKRQYYFSYGETLEAGSFRRRLARWFYEAFPHFKENQTTIAVKTKTSQLKLAIPETVHPTLREL